MGVRKKWPKSEVSEKRAQRFWTKVVCRSRAECWPFIGFRRVSGHGLVLVSGKCYHAHKYAWMIKRGPVPDGLCVNHKCHNPWCCNPEHMYLGTRGDNMKDRFGKTRYRHPRATSKFPSAPGTLLASK